jgi:hypothetical protein
MLQIVGIGIHTAMEKNDPHREGTTGLDTGRSAVGRNSGRTTVRTRIRTVLNLSETIGPEGLMTIVKSGSRHTLPPELDGINSEICTLSSQWERSVCFVPLTCEEGYERDAVHPWLASCISLCQNAALEAHTLILEDSPGIPDLPPSQTGQDQAPRVQATKEVMY